MAFRLRVVGLDLQGSPELLDGMRKLAAACQKIPQFEIVVGMIGFKLNCSLVFCDRLSRPIRFFQRTPQAAISRGQWRRAGLQHFRFRAGLATP